MKGAVMFLRSNYDGAVVYISGDYYLGWPM